MRPEGACAPDGPNAAACRAIFDPSFDRIIIDLSSRHCARSWKKKGEYRNENRTREFVIRFRCVARNLHRGHLGKADCTLREFESPQNLYVLLLVTADPIAEEPYTDPN
jgi:hypothetical protein